MRVALIDPALFTASYDLELMAGLAGAGDEPCLFTKFLTGQELVKPNERIREHFYRLLRDPPSLPRVVYRGLKGVSHFLDMGRLPSVLGAWQPDIIHFQWLPLPIIDRAFVGPLHEIAPIVLTVHDSNPYHSAPGTCLQRIGAAEILRKFDALIVHTDRTLRWLLASGIPAPRVTQIAHGALHTEMHFDNASARESPGNDVVRFLMFGKLKPYKGLDVLVRAVALLTAAQRARCRVTVVGKPYMDTDKLFELIRVLQVEPQFKIELRFVDEDEIPLLFEATEAVVLPYREIDASGVLTLALRAGRAIVASRVGAFAELLCEGSDALLVPPNDAPALAEALGLIIDDPDLRRRLATGAKTALGKVPSWAEIGHATHAVYLRAGSRR
jgi:glycosyltransferase involved in cell wall biosynthesis